jgi:lysophospholipase L1-like esterase
VKNPYIGRKPQKLLTVVFMGDSITEGQYVSPPHRWVDIVSGELVKSYLDSPLSLVFVTRGVSGETTRQGLERFPADVQSHTPDLVTIQFGLNDCNCWATDFGLPRVSEAAYRANLIEMIDRSRRFGAEKIILSNNHTTLRHKPLLNGRTLEEQRKTYNLIVAEVARDTGVQFCDIDAEFTRLSRRELEGELLPYPDWLHLSQSGHRRYASKILPYVASGLRELAMTRGIERIERLRGAAQQ